jgi:hypothetical protein
MKQVIEIDVTYILYEIRQYGRKILFENEGEKIIDR